MTPGAPPVLPPRAPPPRRAMPTPPVLKSDPHFAQLSRDMAGYQQVPLELVEKGLAAANAELY